MMAPERDPQRGAALVVVLLFAALITSLAAAASRTTVSGARAAAAFADAMRADELGRAAADLIAWQVGSGDIEATRGGSFSARLAASTITVDYLSEAARVDVNTAPPKFLGLLFAAAGAESGVAAGIVDRIMQSRRTVGRQEPGAPVRLPGLDRIEQTLSAWSIPADLYGAVRPALTVANRSAKVDPMLADRLVVAALMGADDDRADDFLERRMRGFLNEDEALAQLPDDTRSFAGFIATRAYRAIVRVVVGGRFRRSYELVVVLSNGNAKAAGTPNIVSWQPLLERNAL